MAESRRYALNTQLDIEQILQEAQHRWLRPAEICEILTNHQRFRIAPEPPNRPPSGSLFLFDRKVLRYFRKDGHNWRKKRDGKTVKEAHERLKAGSVDVLHCYYAHGEENENFQRRSYWMLEEDLSNIVLVHYQEVKGTRTNYNRVREPEVAIPGIRENELVPNSEVDSSVSSRFYSHDLQVNSQVTDTASLSSAQASEYEDAESAYNIHSFLESQQPLMQKVENGFAAPYYAVSSSDIDHGLFSATFGMNLASTSQEKKDRSMTGTDLAYVSGRSHDFPSWDNVLENETAGYQTVHFQPSFSNMTSSGMSIMQSHVKSDDLGTRKADYSSLKQPRMDGLKEGLKKLDSFDRWMSKELGDVDESHIQSSSETYWDAVENEDGADDSSIGRQVQLDTYLLSPSLSRDQYFSIFDFSPNWAYAGSEIKVLIMGRFLKSQQEMENCRWACMFGEVEVPAEIIADGVLRCLTPLQKAGRVPFYVTCSNRLACSEVREFEFRLSVADASVGPSSESILLVKLAKLLSLGSRESLTSVASNESDTDTTQLCAKIDSLLKVDENEWEQMLMHSSEEKFSTEKVKDLLLQKLLKEKLHNWLLQKIVEGGKGPSVLDEGGQGVLHLAAALGYDWAIPPTIAAGVSVNYRDINGWTALHWAASYGREQTVGFLISLDAAAGALTDPTPKYPSGTTPADLASSNGHKGIAGYLAESNLVSHLSSLKLKNNKDRDSEESSRLKTVQTNSESDGDLPLKDSLAAVRNATQAAARIHQVFRVQSFQRKQLTEYGERALSLLAVKSNRSGLHNEPVHAAIQIQNKFRSWKGRKDFLLIRKRIINIQAHVRGHQVRKNYKKIMWSVGIVELVLRWRRKGSGLHGSKPEVLAVGPSITRDELSKDDDDYDFLKEGRKQSEKRLQKALARVKSMVQYPEARDQYRRLLNVVSEMHERKILHDKSLNSSESAADFDEDLQALLDNDTIMFA